MKMLVNINELNNEEYQEEIYQYFLCNVDEYTIKTLKDSGILMAYSEVLNCDVLMVNHFGTSWDYVMTNVEWTTDINEI